MDTVLLAVKQTADVIQEADGGVRYLTSADFGGSGGGTIPTNSTQIETSYGNALTTTAEWTIGDTLRRTRVLDLTTDPISEVSVDWFNERTQLNLTLVPIIDTDVEIQTTSTVETGTGLATEYTLERLRTLVADNTIYGQVVTGMAIYWNVEAKSTLLIDIKGSGTMATAPVLQYLRADGTWAELSTLDSTYTALTTSNNQFKKIDCSALQQVRLVFGTVTGNIYLRLRASVAKAGTASGGGGGDASAANQVAVQALAGDDATKAVAIQGITDGKPVTVQPLADLTVTHTFPLSAEGLLDIDVSGYSYIVMTRATVSEGIWITNLQVTNRADKSNLISLLDGNLQDRILSATSLARFSIYDGTEAIINVTGMKWLRVNTSLVDGSFNLTYTLTNNQFTAETKSRQALSKVTGQTVDVSGTSTPSSTLAATTSRIVLTATVNCWFDIGFNPTATVGGTSTYLPAGVPSYPIDVLGGFDTVAVIADSASGKLSIFESL